MSDTIVALATPPVAAALSLIRMTGPKSHQIINQLAPKFQLQKELQYRAITFNHALIDDVVISSWNKPHSYTGEDVVEISCHGNMLIVDQIIDACCQLGARPAEPGEFTRKAFLNGKLDLTQAESVMDLIHAKSERALRAAKSFQQGAFGKKIETIREEILQVLSQLEAYIDFPDEDIEPETAESLSKRIEAVALKVSEYLATAKTGKFLRHGASVVLVGAPNAGKSSLMNALLEDDRVLVSDQPGTTRDAIEAEFILDGISIRLTDTAGLRESDEELENLGMEHTQRALDDADLVLFLVDGSIPNLGTPDLSLDQSKIPTIHCLTKSDLPRVFTGDGFDISTKTGDGLENLKQEIARRLKLDENNLLSESLAINSRHEFHLNTAKVSRSELTISGGSLVSMFWCARSRLTFA
ncbi:MAG: tRNA uridine-5-carboxymethylaminomethyl(34) synthesis GTPase MnmE, partial [Verrucomicrobiota bacterium]